MVVTPLLSFSSFLPFFLWVLFVVAAPTLPLSLPSICSAAAAEADPQEFERGRGSEWRNVFVVVAVSRSFPFVSWVPHGKGGGGGEGGRGSVSQERPFFFSQHNEKTFLAMAFSPPLLFSSPPFLLDLKVSRGKTKTEKKKE